MSLLDVINWAGALGGLGWITEGARRFYRRPKLNICFDPARTGEGVGTVVPAQPGTAAFTTTTAQPQRLPEPPDTLEIRLLHWYHMQVQNTGRGVAIGCRASIEDIRVENDGVWERHRSFRRPIPLYWANTGNRLEEDVEPGEATWPRIDVLYVGFMERTFRVPSPLGTGAGIQTEFPIGNYRFKIRIRDRDNRHSAEGTLSVEAVDNPQVLRGQLPIIVTGEPRCR